MVVVILDGNCCNGAWGKLYLHKYLRSKVHITNYPFPRLSIAMGSNYNSTVYGV